MLNILIRSTKRGAALLTLADILPGVDLFVSLQVTSFCERLLADVTPVWSFARVYAAVTSQIIQMSKRLTTVITAVRSIPSVCPSMASHTNCIVCGVLARLTLVPAVPANVAMTPPNVCVKTILSQTHVATVVTEELQAFT